MTKIIGKPLDEIRKLDIDVDEMSERQLGYIVALGMGELFRANSTKFIPGNLAKYFRGHNPIRGHYKWPDYTSSWEHAGRVFESLPHWSVITRKIVESGDGSPGDMELNFGGEFRIIGPYKKAITKAAAKCVLEGIELEGPK